MINDVYLRFRELYNQTNGKILTQNFLLEKEPSLCIKIDDKGDVLAKLLVLDGSVKKDDLYDWFSIRNIKSKYLNSNKAVGNKMIFSSNNLSLFGRIDTFPLVTSKSFSKLFDVKQDSKNKKTTSKSIFFNKNKESLNIVFQDIINPIELNKLIEKMGFISDDEKKLMEVDSYITDIALSAYYKKLIEEYDCQEEQFFTYSRLVYILNQISDEIQEYAHKQIKLKFFLDKDIEEYEKNELKYLDSNLFVDSSQYLIVKDDQISQPFLDSTLNADKPYMFYKTTKYKIPFPKNKDDILYIKYLDDYLSINKGIFYLELERLNTSKTPFYNKKQFVIRKKKNYELFEFLPNYSNYFKDNVFVVKNYLFAKKGKKLIEDSNPYNEMYFLENDLDSVFCGKKLKNNYFENEIKKIDKNLETYIFLMRSACIEYFVKNQISGKDFFDQVEKVLTDLIFYIYRHTENEKFIRYKVSEAMNIKLSMKAYYKGKIMDIKKELDGLSKKISKVEYEVLTHDEFLLLIGQMAYYLTYQSEASDRTFRLVEHYLKSKNTQKIKSHIRFDFEKYKHKIFMMGNNSKFKNALALVMAYEDNIKLTHDDLDKLIIGLVANNIFFEGVK